MTDQGLRRLNRRAYLDSQRAVRYVNDVRAQIKGQLEAEGSAADLEALADAFIAAIKLRAVLSRRPGATSAPL